MKVLILAGILAAFTSSAFGQASCNFFSAMTNLIRVEGTTEQVAQVNFSCTANGQATPAGTATVQVFVSPALPVTSKVLSGGTGTTEALIQVNRQTPGTNVPGAAGSVQGIVSGSTVNFSAVQVPALAPGDSYSVVISNIRVNATSLAGGSGTPPSISESVFITGNAGSITPTAVSNITVSFAEDGLGTSGLRKAFTIGAGTPGTATGWPVGTGTLPGVNNFAVCNAYSPVADDINVTAAGAASGASLAFVVRVAENFATAFKSAGTEQSQIGVTAGVGNAVTTGTASRSPSPMCRPTSTCLFPMAGYSPTVLAAPRPN